jgi:hypothetical protein
LVPPNNQEFNGLGACVNINNPDIGQIEQLFDLDEPSLHSGSEGTDSLRKESRQKLSDLYCKINRKSTFQKAAKGCFEN